MEKMVRRRLVRECVVCNRKGGSVEGRKFDRYEKSTDIQGILGQIRSRIEEFQF